MLITYGTDGKSIDQLTATGGVKVTNLGDAAQGNEAVYFVSTGMIELSGDVLLSQGSSSMTGQKLTINLKDGTGTMSGRVTTTFIPGGN
jgi:lipopolysaccharide export system protein LptA